MHGNLPDALSCSVDLDKNKIMENAWIFYGAVLEVVITAKQRTPSPTPNPNKHTWNQIHQQVSHSNFSSSQRGCQLKAIGREWMVASAERQRKPASFTRSKQVCQMETKWPSNEMKLNKESLLLWEGKTLKGNWGFIIDICYGCQLIRSINPVWGKFKV